jgi:hypothetical protein
LGVIIWSKKILIRYLSRCWNSVFWSRKTNNIYVKYNKKLFKSFRIYKFLNCELEFKSDAGRKQKMSDLEVVALGLTAEFMSI